MGSCSIAPLLKETDSNSPISSSNNNLQSEEVPLLRASGLTLVLNTPKGRGVYAKFDIPANEIIDVSPVLVLSPEENADHICRTELFHYTYNWPLPPLPTSPQKQRTTQAVILGLGSLFNHSSHSQNIGWTRSISTKTITYTTLRAIRAGEELCISYGSRLTFIDVDAKKYEDSDNEEEIGGLGRIELD